MVLDQQIPLEWAFEGPLNLSTRLGGELDVAAYRRDGSWTTSWEHSSSGRPSTATRRQWPARVQALCRRIVTDYGGDAGPHLDDGRDRSRAAAPPSGPAGLRHAEGEDLRGAPRKAARSRPAGMGGGLRAVRRGGESSLCRRHRQPRVSRPRAGAQEGDEGSCQGGPGHGRHTGQGGGQEAPPAATAARSTAKAKKTATKAAPARGRKAAAKRNGA